MNKTQNIPSSLTLLPRGEGNQNQLHRNENGRLTFIDDKNITHENVFPIRAYPLSAPNEAIALVSADGRELAWFSDLSKTPENIANLIKEELQQREFMPEITAILSVSTFSCPSNWQIKTDKGNTELALKGEEDIRRLSENRLLITDTHGIHYLINDLKKLDKVSRKILDRFL